MAADPRREFMDFYHGLLAGDAELLGIMATEPGQDAPRIRRTRADAEEPFPYLVHSLRMRSEDPWGIWSGQLTLEVHDGGPNARRALEARRRIVEILERRFYDEQAGSAFVGSRIWLEIDEDFSEDTERAVWLHLVFGVRIIAKAVMESVAEREGV